MNYLCLCLAILSQTIFEVLAIRYRSDEIVSPCDDPDIYTADRLMNNTVRIYRGNYYWELGGLPDVKGFISGPFKIPYRDFRPVTQKTKVVTVLGTGDRVGRVVRLEGRRYDSWRTDPGNWAFTISERGDMNDLPRSGVDAIFHNGNNLNPMFIALDPINVRYLTTKAWVWPHAVGDKNGYFGGQFGENFPHDITAAFSYPSSEPDAEYYVYLFKKDKFCFRPNKYKDATIQCEKWYPNKQLFGCEDSSGGSGVVTQAPPIPDKPDEILTDPANPPLPQSPNIPEQQTDGKIVDPDDYQTEAEAEAKEVKAHSSRVTINFILIFLMIIIKMLS